MKSSPQELLGKGFIAVLLANGRFLERALQPLVATFSPFDIRSRWFKFDHSAYYQAEMGSGLQRSLLSFSEPIDVRRLVELKQRCAHLEREYAVAGRRTFNLDPGYLDLYKVVLASHKARANKIYLGAGIWADFTLYYQGGSFRPLPWTFPDFASGAYDEVLISMRGRYRQQLRELRRADGR